MSELLCGVESAASISSKAERLVLLSGMVMSAQSCLSEAASKLSSLSADMTTIHDQANELAEFASMFAEDKLSVEAGAQPERLLAEVARLKAELEKSRVDEQVAKNESQVMLRLANDERAKVKGLAADLQLALRYGVTYCTLSLGQPGPVYSLESSRAGSSGLRLCNWYTDPNEAYATAMKALRAYDAGGLEAFMDVRNFEKGGRP